MPACSVGTIILRLDCPSVSISRICLTLLVQIANNNAENLTVYIRLPRNMTLKIELEIKILLGPCSQAPHAWIMKTSIFEYPYHAIMRCWIVRNSSAALAWRTAPDGPEIHQRAIASTRNSERKILPRWRIGDTENTIRETCPPSPSSSLKTWKTWKRKPILNAMNIASAWQTRRRKVQN